MPCFVVIVRCEQIMFTTVFKHSLLFSIVVASVSILQESMVLVTSAEPISVIKIAV